MADPYTLLGVSRTASEAEIKSAYRKLAKKLHPDMNPGRKDIEQKFKEVTAAYDLLSDPKKRARFDAGEIDSQGNERGFHRGGYGAYGGGDPFGGARGRAGGFGFGGGGFDPDDFLSEFFGSKRGGSSRRGFEAERGSDVTYQVDISFIEACLGGKKRVNLPGGKAIDVTIPPGTQTGHKLRLRGMGNPGGGGAGDALIEMSVLSHPYFTREDHDIHVEAPISLAEAVLGGTIKVPTLSGAVALKVHKGANTGTVMRLKGKGVPRPKGEPGDMFVKLKIVLPDEGVDELAASVEKWAKKHPHDPRKKLGW